jgi:hypothetical protein
MKNLNKKTEFERQWEDLFKGAEMTPSESVWEKIDARLSKEEAGYFKKRAFMFKLLAAASVAFALGIGFFSLNYYLNDSTENQLAQEKPDTELKYSEGPSSPQASDRNKDADPDEAPERTIDSEVSGGRESTKDMDGQAGSVQQASFSDEHKELTEVETGDNMTSIDPENMQGAFLPVAKKERLNEMAWEGSNSAKDVQSLFTSLSDLSSVGINGQDDEVIQNIDHIYLIPVMPKGASKLSRQKDENGSGFTASLDFSAGQFNPNFQQGASSGIAASNAFAADAQAELTSFNATTNKNFLLVRSTGQETKPEITYSYGANVGFRISGRLLVQTGIAYRKANTTISTSGYIENPDSESRIPIVASYQYQLGGLSKVSRMNEIAVLDNRYEFASIPIRAGYVVFDRKLNITLLAGLSSEFFINNEISDNSDFLQTLSSSGAADSPYKNVYFNGTVGTMVGYTFAKNYMVTVEPSYRMALDSFTKDSFYLESYPSSFMVSFGIAYNFR